MVKSNREKSKIKYELYTEKFGVPVFTIISNSKGEIQNQEVVSKIQALWIWLLNHILMKSVKQ